MDNDFHTDTAETHFNVPSEHLHINVQRSGLERGLGVAASLSVIALAGTSIGLKLKRRKQEKEDREEAKKRAERQAETIETLAQSYTDLTDVIRGNTKSHDALVEALEDQADLSHSAKDLAQQMAAAQIQVKDAAAETRAAGEHIIN